MGAMETLAEGTKRGRRSLSTALLIRSVALSLELVGGTGYRRVGRGIVRSCSDGDLQAERFDSSSTCQS